MAGLGGGGDGGLLAGSWERLLVLQRAGMTIWLAGGIIDFP